MLLRFSWATSLPCHKVFIFLFIWVSTSYILFNQSHSLSQLIIFLSNKRLMFILLMTFLLNPNSLKFSNQSFSLSLTYHLFIKKTASFPHQNIQLPPFEFKTHWFNFFIYRFWLLTFHPIGHQITTRIGRSIWGQFFFFFPWTSLFFCGNFLWFVLDFFFGVVNTMFLFSFFQFSIDSLSLCIHVYNFSLHCYVLPIKIVSV